MKGRQVASRRMETYENVDHSKYYMSEVFSVDNDYILRTVCYLTDERKMGCFQKDGKGMLATQ